MVYKSGNYLIKKNMLKGWFKWNETRLMNDVLAVSITSAKAWVLFVVRVRALQIFWDLEF